MNIVNNNLDNADNEQTETRWHSAYRHQLKVQKRNEPSPKSSSMTVRRMRL